MNIDTLTGLQQLLYIPNEITAFENGGFVQYSSIDNLSIFNDRDFAL